MIGNSTINYSRVDNGSDVLSLDSGLSLGTIKCMPLGGGGINPTRKVIILSCDCYEQLQAKS